MNDAGVVIQVHGLFMNGWDMIPLRRRLERSGFRVHQFSYRTRHTPIADNAAALAAFIEEIIGRQKAGPDQVGSDQAGSDQAGAPPVHLVGHSLGGLVILRLLHDFPHLPVGRALALGSPLCGAWAAHRLARWRAGRWLIGASFPGALDGTNVQTVPQGRTFAVIAGNRSLGLASRWLLRSAPPGEGSAADDGVVRLSETRLPGVAAHAIIKVGHVGLLFNRTVADWTAGFLQTGKL